MEEKIVDANVESNIKEDTVTDDELNDSVLKHYDGKIEYCGDEASDSADTSDEDSSCPQKQKEFFNALLRTVSVFIVIAAISVLIVTLFFPVLQVAGDSMTPTLENGQVIVLIKTDNVKCGDIIGIRYDGKVLLKRVIGVPGDYVNIDSTGNVYINGKSLDEPYIDRKALGKNDMSYPYQVSENSYFVLGDNRTISSDSRNEKIGCIYKSQIIGKVVIRLWPLGKLAVK